MNHNPTVRIGKISYINASPVYYGLDHGLLPAWLEMVADVPSALNRQIMTGQVVISPISAAFYAQNHTDLLVLPDLSISCHGRVLSVLLVSQYPIEGLGGKHIVFTRESASAASFLKMIFNRKQITPEYAVGRVDDCQRVSKQADAALVIGDTALTQPWDTVFHYCYDLGQLWYEMTQLPFVFAVWAVRRSFARKYPEVVRDIHQLLLASRVQGEVHLERVVRNGIEKTGLPEPVVREYFELLYCDLDEKKIDAMTLFFDSLKQQGILYDQPRVNFFEFSG